MATCAADEMLEHRAQPTEKKSHRNDERHFRFSVCPFTKDDGNFAYTQRSAGPHHCLENNFETAGLRFQFEQPGTADGKEAAHRIAQAGKRVSQYRSCSRYNPAPDWN